MPDPLTIRRARGDEEQALAALRHRALHALGAGHYPAAAIDALLAHVAAGTAALLAAGQLLVAERDGALLGCAGWSWDSGAGDRAALAPRPGAFLRSVYVAPEAVGRGIGRRLLAAAEAGAGGAPQLVATLNAAPMYRACGYASLGAVVLPLPGGNSVAGLHMIKAASAGAVACPFPFSQGS